MKLRNAKHRLYTQKIPKTQQQQPKLKHAQHNLLEPSKQQKTTNQKQNSKQNPCLQQAKNCISLCINIVSLIKLIVFEFKYHAYIFNKTSILS